MNNCNVIYLKIAQTYTKIALNSNTFAHKQVNRYKAYFEK